MKRHLFAASTLLVPAVLLVLTKELYFDVAELLIFLGGTLVLACLYRPHLLTAYLAYAGLTLFDLCADYLRMTLASRRQPQDGRAPYFSEVVPEAYDDLAFWNLVFPLVLGLCAMGIARMRNKKGRV